MPEAIAPHPERASLADLIAVLTQTAGEDFLEVVASDDMDELALRPGGLLAVIARVREAGFNHLLDIGGTDHHPLTPRFEISYILTAIALGDQRDPLRFANGRPVYG